MQNFAVFRDFFIAKGLYSFQNKHLNAVLAISRPILLELLTFYMEVPHGKEKSSKETGSKEKRQRSPDRSQQSKGIRQEQRDDEFLRIHRRSE